MARRLNYLVDTNVWLELLLEQERADEVHQFFQNIPKEMLVLTEFSLDSIAIALTRLKKDELLKKLLSDLLVSREIEIVRLNLEDLLQLLGFRVEIKLDYDDAYQYTAAEKFDLTIVSFDSDFDQTKRGRKTPAEALAEK